MKTTEDAEDTVGKKKKPDCRVRTHLASELTRDGSSIAFSVSLVSSMVFISVLPKKKGAIARALGLMLGTLSYLPPNPADCIDCREMSAVDAIPCIRSLKSSALEAFSSAVS